MKILLFAVSIFTLASCSVAPPDDTAMAFYDKVVNDDLTGAKELCMPSAKEELERLEDINAFERNINKGTFELMEVVVAPKPLNGDTAIVNYKVDGFKNYLTLILKDKQWKVAMSEELKEILTLEFESFELADMIREDKDGFWDKFYHMNLVVKNLAIDEYSFVGIPFSPDKNMLYLNNNKGNFNHMGGPREKRYYTIGGKNVDYNESIALKRNSFEDFYVFELKFDDISNDDKSKLKPSTKLSRWDERVQKYNVNTIAVIRGRYCGDARLCDSSVLSFSNQ